MKLRGCVRKEKSNSFSSSPPNRSHQSPQHPLTQNNGVTGILLAYQSLSRKNGRTLASRSWKPSEGAMSMNSYCIQKTEKSSKTDRFLILKWIGERKLVL